MRQAIFLGAALAGVVIGPALAGDNYGAIAYSPSTGAHGYAFDYPSRGVAERRALASCSRHAGDCQVPLWFRNACGALAVGNGGGWGTGWGASRRMAERSARRSCRKFTKGCTVLRWVCTAR